MLQVTYPSPGEHPSAPRERGIFPITDDELCDLASTGILGSVYSGNKTDHNASPVTSTNQGGRCLVGCRSTDDRGHGSSRYDNALQISYRSLVFPICCCPNLVQFDNRSCCLHERDPAAQRIHPQDLALLALVLVRGCHCKPWKRWCCCRRHKSCHVVGVRV